MDTRDEITVQIERSMMGFAKDFDNKKTMERILFNSISQLRQFYNYGQKMKAIGRGFEPSGELTTKDLIYLLESDYRERFGELPDNEFFNGPIL